ncbi:putative RNA-directed DNA polymerase from transposon X-element, partial [Trichonephila inaurata madagascariensis]
MEIDILKAKRKSLRAAFTFCCNGISNRIETETLGNNEVNALYKQLQDKFSRLETTQEEIFDFLLKSEELKKGEYAKSNDENTVVSSSVLSNQSVINETVYLQILVLKIEHNETKEHDIELLLGADVIGNILTGNGNSLKLSSGVTVVQTKFGNTVIRKTNTIYNNLYSNVVSLHCANFTLTDLWNLDAIGITDPTEDAKRKHAHSDFLNQFKENLSVLPDGWYELPLPFKFETQLPNNKSATIKRHKRMCQRIDEQNQLNDYE